MAFDTMKQRLPDQEQEEDENTTTERPHYGNTVATQSWVGHVLDRIWAWTYSFKTKRLQVDGPISSGNLTTNGVQTNFLTADHITLVNSNGQAMRLYVDENGALKTEFDFKNLFLYPGSGEYMVRKYSYDPQMSAYENFMQVTPRQLLKNFHKYEDDVKMTTYDGKTCYKLYDADGKDEIIPKTLLITCDYTKKISKLVILNDKLEETKTIPLTTPVRNVTINMPCFNVDGMNVYPVVPKVCYTNSKAHCSVPLIPGVPPPFPMPPFPGYIDPCPPHFTSPYPLSPSLFDDPEDVSGTIFWIEDDDCKCKFGSTNEDEPLDGLVEVTAPDPSDEQVLSSGNSTSPEPQHMNFTTNTYTNVVLKRSDFDTNQVQYLKIETVDANLEL